MNDTSPTGTELADLERRSEQTRVTRDGWTLIIFAVAALALLTSVLGVGLALRAVDEADAFGAVVIDPPNLPPVDHEYALVQSELYLGPEGQPGDLDAMQNEEHDAVVFNGFVNQYKDRPIRVEPGERVRVWVLDAGPNENSAFHIVGTIFDTVFKEGTYLLQPDGRQGGSQALDLQPSQGGFVEFTFDEAGLYPIVTHKFANVGKGALGLFQAGEVETAGGDH